MHCVVTAGPTAEPLDHVRRLTNFSTGRLGVELAGFLTHANHRVTLLVGEHATWRGERLAHRVETFTDTASLREHLRALGGEGVTAVFHAAAVSDFSFGKVWTRAADGQLGEVKSGKFSTREGVLLAELVPTPKIIAELRGWFPKARIVGWKYEVDGDRTSAIQAAISQIRSCHTDACVANGPAYGEGFGLVSPGEPCRNVPDRPALYAALEALVRA